MRSFAYPVLLKPDHMEGGFVVTCRDIPEAITQGESLEDALYEAADCLDEALHARILDDKAIPLPGRARKAEVLVSPPAGTALKLAVYLAMREQHISKSELARRMGVDEKEVRRALDPHHPTKTPRLEEALHAMGRRVEVRVFNNALRASLGKRGNAAVTPFRQRSFNLGRARVNLTKALSLAGELDDQRALARQRA
jgi:antitoxin HicB